MTSVGEASLRVIEEESWTKDYQDTTVLGAVGEVEGFAGWPGEDYHPSDPSRRDFLSGQGENEGPEQVHWEQSFGYPRYDSRRGAPDGSWMEGVVALVAESVGLGWGCSLHEKAKQSSPYFVASGKISDRYEGADK